MGDWQPKGWCDTQNFRFYKFSLNLSSFGFKQAKTFYWTNKSRIVQFSIFWQLLVSKIFKFANSWTPQLAGKTSHF